MFQRLLEILLGLQRGFLDQNGHFTVQFNPDWPLQKYSGPGAWNIVLGVAAVILVYMVYRREGRARPARIVLGIMRLALLGFVLTLLNRPVLTLQESRREPSVLPILIDTSLSMKVPDMPAGSDGAPMTRLQAIADLVGGKNGELLRQLGKQHIIKFYTFDRSASELVGIDAETDPNSLPANDPYATAIKKIDALRPTGSSTQLASAIRGVLDTLQGQRVAGIVVLSDGKDVPTENLAQTIAAIKSYNVHVYPIIVGADKSPENISVESVNVQDSAFKGDIVDVTASIRAVGYPPGHPVVVQLKDKKTGALLIGPNKQPVEKTVNIDGPNAQNVELLFKADQLGTLDFQVVAVPQPGEINDQDNVFASQIDILDAKINVLYVDGYPRWDYRYVKTEMLRQTTLRICCLLQSADLGYKPEFTDMHNDPEVSSFKYFPYSTFPDSLEKLQECDVVLLGDVDPNQFSDRQYQVLRQWVAEKGGGFGMIAGPRFSPQAFKNTPIADLLPISITKVEADDSDSSVIAQGFRPVLTPEGKNSSIFRFYADRDRNDDYMKNDIQALFWYCRGITVKPDVGEVLAEHPTELGPDMRKAPLLVLGHYGAGRTLFSAIDDSWRWRYYTGEPVFDTYWVQQIRYLARQKKLGQRKMTLASQRPVYQIGELVQLKLHILDSSLLSQLQQQVSVEIVRNSDGAIVGRETLSRQPGQPDVYLGAYTADQTGGFSVRLPSPAPGIADMNVAVNVEAPGGELDDPRVDHKLAEQLVDATDGQNVEFAQARERLPGMIPSAAKIIPNDHTAPLWDAPLAMAIFVLLITLEWVLRKVFGML